MNVKIMTTACVLALSLLVSCGQKDPVGDIDLTGSIFVTSSVDGATIFIDGVLRPEVTPDTLEDISLGDHTVSLEKEGYQVDPASRDVTVKIGEVATASFTLTPAGAANQRIVLLEDFSNTGCVPCVQSDSIVTLMLESYGTAQLVGIQYHVSWPYPGDPFYLGALGENTARTSYYGVAGIGVPYVVIDGLLAPSPTNGAAIQGAIEERRNIGSSLQMRAWNEINGSSGLASGEVISKVQDTAGHYRLRFVVLETDIHHDAPNGLDLFINVMRAMLPDADGVTFHMEADDTSTFSQPYTIDQDWNTDKLSVVVFVQDEDTKEVLQAASSLNP